MLLASEQEIASLEQLQTKRKEELAALKSMYETFDVVIPTPVGVKISTRDLMETNQEYINFYAACIKNHKEFVGQIQVVSSGMALPFMMCAHKRLGQDSLVSRFNLLHTPFLEMVCHYLLQDARMELIAGNKQAQSILWTRHRAS